MEELKEDRDIVMVKATEREIWQTNRELKRAPKNKKFWCWTCDACYVRRGEKCKRCGGKPWQRTNKKE